MKTFVWISIMLFVLRHDLLPADEKFIIEQVSLEKGIPNNLVFSIFQDSKGLLWFGTMFGLVRYDGVNYKTYRNNPNDTNSLSNDDITSIYEDIEGNLWLGTFNGGLNKFNRAENKFTRYLYNENNPGSISSNTIWDIIQDEKGNMWFATDRGGLVQFSNERFIAYKRDTTKPGSISGNNIHAVSLDRHGNIWAGTGAAGVNKFDRKKNVFKNYRFDDKSSSLHGSNFVTTVFKDDQGNLWVGTGGGGLNKYDEQHDEFIRYTHDSTDISSLSNNFVHAIAQDSPGVLLIGTRSGYNTFNVSTGKFERFKLHNDSVGKNQSVITLAKDKSGVIWLSSYTEGLYKALEPSGKFQSALKGKNVTCIFEDSAGRLWAGTFSDGLFMSTDKGKTFKNISGENKSLPEKAINSVIQDNQGNIWIGSSNGLYIYNQNLNLLKSFSHDPKNVFSISNNSVLKLLCAKDGTVWVGTAYGLNKFNADSGTFKRFQTVRGDSNSLSDNTILSIYEDKENVLWVGTYAGLNRFDGNNKFRHFRQDPYNPMSISNNYVFSFCEDNNSNFWIGTGGGLNIYDRKAGTFFHYNTADGLPSGVISGIESSDDGYLWLSTNKGISRFDMKNNSFRNYDSYDGLPSNMFNSGAYFRNSAGEIFFGSIKGLSYFKPANIKDNNFLSPIVLTSFTKYINNSKVEFDISQTKEIELSYKDDVIKFDFASMDFTNPSKVNYAYMLEGFDKNWIHSGNQGSAVYTNLNPGEYVFKVKGTNADGVWNENAASVILNISPPFWKTWWFYALAVCTIAAGVYSFQNFRVRKRVKHFLELESIKEKERELMREQAARDYHDELGHKLTRISLYSRRINKKLRPTANGLTNDLNSIVETSNSLQSGAKDLIWAMNPHEDSLYDLAVRLKDFGNDLFDSTGINFICHGIEESFKKIILSMNCKRHLIYIFKEGMNNILKHSRCSEVSLEFKINRDKLEIILLDNGGGFEINNSQKGYGLKNIFLRAKHISAEVLVNSRNGKGTEIYLRTPLSKLISA